MSNSRSEAENAGDASNAVGASDSMALVSGSDLNESLRHFGMVYQMDGDLMRCKCCNRAIIASRIDEQLIHADGCVKAGYMDNENPWQILTKWLAR